MQSDITYSQQRLYLIVFSDVKLLHLKLFGEFMKSLLIASGSILLCDGGTAGSCNLLRGIFHVQGICTQRKPLRNKVVGQRPQRFLFPIRRSWVECI